MDVARVKQLLAQGITQTNVAKRLGINKSTVCTIAAGKYTEGK